MEALLVFLASIVGASLSEMTLAQVLGSPMLSAEQRKAIRFVVGRTKRWVGEYSRRMHEPWPDPNELVEKLWWAEQTEAVRSQELDDGWYEAEEALGNGVPEKLFAKCLSSYDAAGLSSIEALTRYGDAAPDLLFPLDSTTRVVTSPFGWRVHPVYGTRKFHDGLDLRAAVGTHVLAPAKGTVAYTTSSGACGWGICVDHGGGVRTIFCHLSRKDVAKGERVEAGQVIGLSGGAKGHPGAGTSTAAHLHFGVRVKQPNGDWKPVDPTSFVSLSGSKASTSWWDWFFGPSADPVDEEAPSSAVSTWDTAPGVDAVLVDAGQAIHYPGEVDPGRYELRVVGREPSEVVLEAGRRYRASSIGRLFPFAGGG